MSDLPATWVEATLADVAKWGSGGTPTSTKAAYYGGDIPWAVIGDLTDGFVDRTAKSITQRGLDESSAKRVEPGTLLIAMYGSIGKLGIARIPMATNQAIATAVPDTRVIDPAYLFWYLRSQRSRLAAAGKGATQDNVGQGVLRAWPIPLAPLSEQRRIVEAIEEQLSRLDAAEESLPRAKVNLERLKSAQGLALFDGGWPTHPLQDLTEAGRPICYGILMPKDHRPDGVPYVRVKDYPRGRIELSGLRRTSHEIAERYRRSTLRGGDVLLAIRGTYGRVAIVPQELSGGNITQDTARISPTREISAAYLAAYLRSEAAQRYYHRVARGVAVRGVNLADVKAMPIPLPSLEDQAGIAAQSEHVGSVVAALEEELDLDLARARQLRQSILREAFAGHLAPQDPSDKPEHDLRQDAEA